MTAASTYNCNGLRVGKTVRGTTTTYAWDPTGLPVVVSDGTAYVWGRGLISQIIGGAFWQVEHSGPAILLHDDAATPSDNHVIAIQIAYERDRFGWMQAFRVLGIGRWQLMLPELGLPTAMAANPEVLAHVAHQLLEAGLDDRWRGLAYGPDKLSAVVQEAFARLVRMYGGPETQALYNWAQRLFVDDSQRACWRSWQRMFMKLANHLAGHGDQSAELPFSPAENERVSRAILDRFEPAARDHDRNLIASLKRIPTTPLEERVLALETLPDMINLARDIELALGAERAHQVWVELDSWLTDSRRDRMLHWAREQAVLIGMPRAARELRLPDRLGG